MVSDNEGDEDEDCKVGVSWNQIEGGSGEDVAGSPLILSLSPTAPDHLDAQPWDPPPPSAFTSRKSPFEAAKKLKEVKPTLSNVTRSTASGHAQHSIAY